MKRVFMIALLFLAALAAKPAAASCTAYASSLVFGNYSGSLIDVTATVTVQCTTANSAFTLGLDQGQHGTITNRVMFGGSGGSNTVGYQLFSDSARTINWGNSSGTWVTGTAAVANQGYTFTVYGRMPANENSPTGSYTDSVYIWVNGINSGTFSITATVAPSCSISANALSFGAYTGSAALNSTSTISVTCANGSAYNVGLNAGTATGATVTTRQMMNGTKTLNYSLYSDSGRTRNWGNTVGTDTLAGTGSGAAQTLTVYGTIPSGQTPVPGSYTDTITATLTY
ncbi:MAG TPA: spore coat U domain-containing protein [Terracidiphilus sp.]|nr:spore coat U domain-containing protein [Terracidiphilus sp.]